ncbi:MAG: NADH-quinone oxidoreductase subunit K [Bacillota bacterium]|nr:NADH-quinone oxidoreductase subunit K [Bacillota bacterium]
MSVFNIAVIIAALMLIFIGLFMLVRTNNLIRVIIAIEVVMKAITLLLIFAGYMNGQMALAQSFVITMIVVEVVVAVVAAGVALSIYRRNNDTDIRKLNKLNG